MRSACTIQNKVWPPPLFKKTSWSLIYLFLSECIFTDRQTQIEISTIHRSRERLCREWTLEKLPRVKSKVLPRCAREQLKLCKVHIFCQHIQLNTCLCSYYCLRFWKTTREQGETYICRCPKRRGCFILLPS
jgi:hypothetical protein